MEYVRSYPESEIIQMWDRAFREDYKRRGYDLDDKKQSSLPNEEEKERLKKLYGWSK